MLVKTRSSDEYRNNSYFKYKSVNFIGGYIETPVIVYPINDCRIGNTGNLYIHSAEFLSLGLPDTLNQVEVRFAHDPLSDDIITTCICTPSNDLPDRVLIPESVLSTLELYTPIYISVRFIGNLLEPSEWSVPIRVYCIPGINERGTVCYRHTESNKGTVVEFLDAYNNWSKMIIGDASTRALNLMFGNPPNHYYHNPELIKFRLRYNTYNNYSIFGGNAAGYAPIPSDEPIPPIVDNKRIADTWNPVHSLDKTGYENDQSWMKVTNRSNLQAINHCHSQTILNKGILHQFHLPNVHEGCIIFMLSDFLDTLDPTANTYPDRKLGYTNPNGRCNRKKYTVEQYAYALIETNTYWSESSDTGLSQYYTNMNAVDITYTGCGGYGQCFALTITVPILEI